MIVTKIDLLGDNFKTFFFFIVVVLVIETLILLEGLVNTFKNKCDEMKSKMEDCY